MAQVFSTAEDFLKSLTPEATPAGTISSLAEERNFGIVRDYMADRFGMTEDEYSKEEIIDSYINNMRGFSFGQSVTTLTELAHLNRGDEQELERRRKIAGDAYRLFDSMENVFSYGDAKEKLDAIYDYGRALIVDPVNVLSLGIGKVAASGSTKAAAEIAKRAAIEASEAFVKSDAAKGLSATALRQGQREAARRAVSETIKRSSYKDALSRSAKAEILGATVFDAGADTAIEAARQEAEVLAGSMDEYDPLQMAMSTLGGLSGGGLSYGLYKMRGVSGHRLASLEIDRHMDVIDRARQVRMEEAAKNLDPKESASKVNSEEVSASLDKFVVQFEPFINKIRRGLEKQYLDGDVSAEATDAAILRLFYLGDTEGKLPGIKQIFEQAGLPGYSKRNEKDRFTNWFGDVVRSMPEELRDKLKESYNQTVLKFSTRQTSFDDFLDIRSAQVSEFGRGLQAESALAKSLSVVNKQFDDTTVKEAADIVLEPVSKDFREKVADGSLRIQHNLIRMLVTHPGTTALNLMGWSQATITQSFSDTIRATLYGGTAMLKALTNDQVGAKKYANLARQMATLQGQKVRNLVDPYMTIEEAMDYLTFRPEAQKKMFRYLTGGIEEDSLLKEMGALPGETIDRSKTDKVIDFFQAAYGVKAQDLLTKTQEFMYAIDRRIRLEYGMSYKEFLDDPEMVAKMIGKGSAEDNNKFLQIEAGALDDALRNTFSKPFGEGKDTLAFVARIIENMRNYPVIGAMVPFGQFFNNTLAFMFDHTGISLLHKFAVGSHRDTMELATKTAAGWGIIGITTVNEMENLEEGLAWYEERDRTGAIRNRLYDFPYSFHKMMGRMGAHILRDEKVPEELVNDAARTFGIQAITRQLGEATGTAWNTILALSSGEFGEAQAQGVKALQESVSMYASGFTRVADPLNQIIAISRGDEYSAIDRNQGNKMMNDSLRYVDQIVEVMMGEPLAPERESAVTGEAQPAPIGRLTGYREVTPQSTIQKMFNDIGRPQWKTEIITSVPEAGNVFNKHVFPIIEMYADSIVDTKKWAGMTLKQKEDTVKKILSRAKGDIKDALMNSYDMDDRKVGMIFSITNRNISKSTLRDILEQFGTSEKELWKLDVPQLELIDSFLADESFRKKIFEEELGLAK